MEKPNSIDTERPGVVAEAVKAVFAKVWGGGDFPVLDRVFRDVTGMFEGRHPGYRAIDMEYHDFEHTLQATVCLTHLLEGRALSGDPPVLGERLWELSVISALLHDTGFLKRTGTTPARARNTPSSMSAAAAISPAPTCRSSR